VATTAPSGVGREKEWVITWGRQTNTHTINSEVPTILNKPKQKQKLFSVLSVLFIFADLYTIFRSTFSRLLLSELKLRFVLPNFEFQSKNMFLVRPIFRGPSLWALHSSHACFSASAAAVHAERTIKEGPRNDWSRDEVKSIYDSPILDLLFHGVILSTFCFNGFLQKSIFCFCFQLLRL